MYRVTAVTLRPVRTLSARRSPAPFVSWRLGLAASVKVRESDASISLRLPGSLGQTAESTCQALLTGMMVYFAQLHDEYPEHIEVLEDE